MPSLLMFLNRRVARLMAALMLGLPAICAAAPEAPAQPNPATRPALPPAKPVPGAKLSADLEYGRADGKPLLLDLYVPSKAEPGKLPLVVWVHGGGWSAGSRREPPAKPLIEHGFAVASVEYRLSQPGRSFIPVIAAIRDWGTRHFRADNLRVAS